MLLALCYFTSINTHPSNSFPFSGWWQQVEGALLIYSVLCNKSPQSSVVQNSQHFICSQFCGPEVRARLGWMGLLFHVASAGIPPEVVVRWWLGLECPRRLHHRSGTLVVMTGISLFLSLPLSQFMQGCLQDLSSASLHGSWVLIVSIVRGKARSCIKYMAPLLGHSISPSKIYGDPRSTGSVNRLHTLAGEWQEHTTKKHGHGGYCCRHLWKHNLIMTWHNNFSFTGPCTSLYVPFFLAWQYSWPGQTQLSIHSMPAFE